LSACFDSIGDGLSGYLDRLSSRLNGLFGLVELAWAIGILQRLTFAGHLSSPRQRAKLTPRIANRSADGLLKLKNRLGGIVNVRGQGP
jgi:hypothetical protein